MGAYPKENTMSRIAIPSNSRRYREIDEVVLLEERIKGLCVKIIDRINSEGVKP